MTINIGFIGCGFVAQQCHLPSYDSLDSCSIVAVSDLHEDLSRRIAARYEVPNSYNSHKDLLLDDNIEAVVVTLPRPLTVAVCRDAVMAGKKVFTEKPICLNSKNGRELINLSQSHNTFVQVGYMRRFDAATNELKNILDRNFSTGNYPRLINAYCYMGDSYCSPFGDFKSKTTTYSDIVIGEAISSSIPTTNLDGYQMYLNVFSHIIDLLTYLLNSSLQPRFSQLNNAGTGHAFFTDCANNIPISLATNTSALNEWQEGLEFIFEDQTVKLELSPAFLRNVPSKIIISSGNSSHTTSVLRPKWSWAFRNQAESFVKQCRLWPTSESNLEAAVNHVELLEHIFTNLPIGI